MASRRVAAGHRARARGAGGRESRAECQPRRGCCLNADPHAAGCAAIAEAIFVDQLDRAVSTPWWGRSTARSTRLQRLAVEAREDVANLVQGNAGGLYASPLAAAAKVRAARVRVAGAPHGTWGGPPAGPGVGPPPVAVTHARGHVAMALRQAAATGARLQLASAHADLRAHAAVGGDGDQRLLPGAVWMRGPLPRHATAAVRRRGLRRVAPHAHRRRARARVCARPGPRAARAVRRRPAAAPPRARLTHREARADLVAALAVTVRLAVSAHDAAGRCGRCGRCDRCGERKPPDRVGRACGVFALHWAQLWCGVPSVASQLPLTTRSSRRRRPRTLRERARRRPAGHARRQRQHGRSGSPTGPRPALGDGAVAAGRATCAARSRRPWAEWRQELYKRLAPACV